MDKLPTGPEVLDRKYKDIRFSTAIRSANRNTKEEKPAVRIQNYLDRFTKIIQLRDPGNRQSGLDHLKGILHSQYIVKQKDIPESYWENQRRILRDRGQAADLTHVDWEGVKDLNTEAIVADQTKSLDAWVDYLASPDAMYPDWLKYYAMRSVLGMGDYNKERKVFTKRDKTTVKPFPEVNAEALSYVLNVLETKYLGKEVILTDLGDNDKADFQKLLDNENFSKLYAWSIEKITPASTEQLKITEGRWIKYNRGSDSKTLVESIQGHGTGWCTVGESTAKSQLSGGDFYIYYSIDKNGQATIPRVAIRMEGQRLAEIRGISKDQNLDPYISDSGVIRDKLTEFGSEGTAYIKRDSDMQTLTFIDHKFQRGEELDRSDLTFLYEVDSRIEGFGYNRDPRIEEIKQTRSLEVDIPIIFNCTRDEIMFGPDDIVNEKTKVYIGKLFPGIFKILPESVEMFTSFPDKKIIRQTIPIGGISINRLKQQLKDSKIDVNPGVVEMMERREFTVEPNKRNLNIVTLNMSDLGLRRYPTNDQVTEKVLDFGLELCPFEVGPHLRLLYKDQPYGEWLFVGSKTLRGPGGFPSVFKLTKYNHGLYLGYARLEHGWGDDNRVIFSIPE